MNRSSISIAILIFIAVMPAQSGGQENSLRESVVLVRTEMHGSGTGVVIGPLHVMTANHVVANQDRLRVETNDRFVEARVVARDAANDVAILKLESELNNPPLIIRNQPLVLTETVTMLGHAQGRWTLTETTGTVIGIQSDNGSVSWARVSVPVTHGMSGGPVVDVGGKLASIIVAVTLENSVPTHAMVAPNHALNSLAAQLLQTERVASP